MWRLAVLAALASAADITDLQRAQSKVPRSAYKGSHFRHMGEVLNKHLKKQVLQTLPCHEWKVEDLQTLQAKVFELRQQTHNDIYEQTKDRRGLRFNTLHEHQEHWGKMNKAASTPILREMQRDGHCHEAIMWFTHHLDEQTRRAVSNWKIPTLPLQEWARPNQEDGTDAANVYDNHYNPSSTCQACHSGGMAWQADSSGKPAIQPAALPRQVNGNDRKRRCDEWYGATEGGACGACDGLGGSYWGDLPDESIYPSCEVVANASGVPKEQRVHPGFPGKFAVEMRGADRWPRASPGFNASCNHTTDCSPIGEGGDMQAERHHIHWYANLHGTLYVDHNPGMFGGGRLRHESVYELPNGRGGSERALKGLYGETNIHATEIHSQSAKQAQARNPSVMKNIHHTKEDKANASGVPETSIDWRRMPNDGMCVCIPDPAGLPDFMGAFDNATYLGRVKMVPLWQTAGKGGPPDGKPIIVDHYAKWTFHIWVDVETKLPAMFTSPYGGSATYGNWTIYDNATKTGGPDEMWPEWRKDPWFCLNVMLSKDCPWLEAGDVVI